MPVPLGVFFKRRLPSSHDGPLCGSPFGHAGRRALLKRGRCTLSTASSPHYLSFPAFKRSFFFILCSLLIFCVAFIFPLPSESCIPPDESIPAGIDVAGWSDLLFAIIPFSPHGPTLMSTSSVIASACLLSLRLLLCSSSSKDSFREGRPRESYPLRVLAVREVSSSWFTSHMGLTSPVQTQGVPSSFLFVPTNK